MRFPKDFMWGTATSSYQIEGGVNEDGKGTSIWDEFSHIPGKIHDGSTGDTACDHYHRFRGDIKLMADLGIKNYRLSVSWARILPEGTGRINPAGIRFYSDLIDCLLENGIRPFVTLYHWDLPSALHRKGAWLNDEMPEWFAEYTLAVANALGGRVRDFFTINEPQCIIGNGYTSADHAPGVVYPIGDKVRMIHNLLKSHGRAVQVLREKVADAKVGFAPCSFAPIPCTDSAEDVAACRCQYFSVPEEERGLSWNTAWYSDPVCLGIYPEEGLKRFGKYLPHDWKKDMELIHQAIDYYAQNIYEGRVYRAGEYGPEQVDFPAGHPRTAINWPIVPEALYWGPKFLFERYGIPVVITENGMSAHDAVSLDGSVHDPNRIDYVHRYLRCLRKAVEDGVDVRGYFYWSFMDNFEWAFGYQERFGLVYVDYQTQQRIPKDSALWYRTVIKQNGENL